MATIGEVYYEKRLFTVFTQREKVSDFAQLRWELFELDKREYNDDHREYLDVQNCLIMTTRTLGKKGNASTNPHYARCSARITVH